MLQRQIKALLLALFASVLLAAAAQAESVPGVMLFGSARNSATKQVLSFLNGNAGKLSAIGLDVYVSLTDDPSGNTAKAFPQLGAADGNLQAQLRAKSGLAQNAVGTPEVYVVDGDGNVVHSASGKLTTKAKEAVIRAALEVGDIQIEMGLDKKTLNKRKTYSFKTRLTPKFSTKYVRYKSSDTKIARVSQSGKVKGVGYGTATITAYIGGTEDTCEVVVSGPLKKVYLNYKSITLESGQTESLQIGSIVPFNAAVNLENAAWKSSNTRVARVDSHGQVTAVSAGKAKISCKLSGKTGACTVTVRRSGAYAVLEEQVLQAANARRAKAGVRALKYYEPLAQAAQLRAKEISTLFSHTRPNGKSCFTAITFRLRYGAENIAAGFATPEDAMQGWMGSPPHKKALLNSVYKESGVGVFETEDGRIYWVQLFCTR